MALSWRTTDALPRLRTYADADKWEKLITPIRGDKDGTKPVGRRSQKWRHIKREGEAITVYYSRFPLIRFFPDDTVHVFIPDHSNRASEHEMIGTILGVTLTTYNRRSWMGPYKVKGGACLLRDGPRWGDPAVTPKMENRFRHTPEGWVYLNPLTLVTHHIRRNVLKDELPKYANFISYARAMLVLKEDFTIDDFLLGGYDLKATEQQIEEMRKWNWLSWQVRSHSFAHCHRTHDQAKQLCKLMLSKRPEDNWLALLHVVGARGDYDLRVGSTLKDVVRQAVLHAKRDTVLERVEAEPGRIVKDRYASLFRI